MTHRDTCDHNQNRNRGRNFYRRRRERRRQKDRQRLDRHLNPETLEPRQLLAGPDLIGVQPNEGSLINGGEILSVSPREIVFRFDDSTELDPTTLDGIRITRSGEDGVFESAIATSDLGTAGAALVEFRAVQTGGLGNGIEVHFVSRVSGSSVPVVSVSDRVVTIEVNRNPTNPTRVLNLVTAVANDSEASQLLEVIQVTGSSQTPVGITIEDGLSLTLAGANAAEATTDFGTGGAVAVRIVSQLSGSDGLGTEVTIERRNFGGAANPLVVVTGKSILVQLNSNFGNESTVQDFIDAINNNPDSAALINVLPLGGDLTTPIGGGTAALPQLTLTGVTDVSIEPGFIGLGDSPREVLFRFAEPLPDDLYQIDILGTGPSALLNTIGEPFGDGVNETRQFSINLGPKVVAVVPEPVRRNASGQLIPQAGIIEVYFNDDALNAADATNPDFYQLVFTRDTANNTDDFVVPLTPGSVQYDSGTGIASLNFGRPLARIIDPATGAEVEGAARLRVGTIEGLPAAPVEFAIAGDPDDMFAGATPISIGSDEMNSVRLSSEIENTVEYGLTLPGPEAPGVRDLRPEDPSRLSRQGLLGHLRGEADAFDGITVAGYSFPSSWLGDDPDRAGIELDTTYFNVISELQKERVREAMTLFSEYIGISFYEVDGDVSDNPEVLSIAVGDLYGADADSVSGEGGLPAAVGFNNDSPLVVMDFQDFEQSTDDQFGGEFFRGSMFAVGQLLGFGHALDLPQPITQPPVFGDAEVSSLDNEIEPSYPAVADILHGQYLFRPDSTDIDLYKFELTDPGAISIETQAERLTQPSLLDTTLRLYREVRPGEYVEVAQNNDYFSNDSLINYDVIETGTYVVGVSAHGNNSYDPSIDNSGFGGLTEGEYDLIVTFDPLVTDVMTDTTGVALDGDGDGRPGGVFDFWFEPADPTDTIYVDKEASLGGTGSISNPFQQIDLAIAEAIRRGSEDVTIRVVGNGGLDGRIETIEDNFSYQIGTTSIGTPLEDGRNLDLPKGVDLIFDAGAIVKLSDARIGVGSVSPTVDVSDASLQVLGTPNIITSTGLIARDSSGAIIPGSVYFTSINDSTVGAGNTPEFTPAAGPGDWGGIDFRSDLDFADESRRNRELEGVFLNHIQFADMRYGGGSASIAGRQVVVSPIDMAATRATIINSRITHSADAAIAATPDTFAETVFTDPVYQTGGTFTPDYSRIGPRVSGNTVIDNSINGMFIRVVTRTGDRLEKISTATRFDDTDITHVLAENLVIDGTAGGAIVQTSAPPTLLVETFAVVGTGDIPAGEYTYRLTNVDSIGLESAASLPTESATLLGDGAIRLERLPQTGNGDDFVARRLYRAEAGSPDEFRLVATLNSNDTIFVDTAAAGSTLLSTEAAVMRSRLDASLVIDPGTVVKLDSARIEARLGADLKAEGLPSLPIVFTSIEDQRYGAGGTFDTNDRGDAGELNPGDWGGIYIGPAGSASIDHAVIAGGGGTTRIEGGFASFNAIEVHQGDLRFANSRMEFNADGRGAPNGERVGRGENEPGGLFVRAAAPIIVDSKFVGNESAPISIDLNSFASFEVSDPGRSTGDIDRVELVGNTGPLLQGNVLDSNSINGMQVRGGKVATSVTLDDVDVVHVVTEAIEIPNQHVFGGLRLQSDARGSLVVKFESAENETAGIVVGGTFETATEEFGDIADRIGGSLQIIGHPDFPVVLTTLADDTAGAGVTLDGSPGLDTNNNGIAGVDLSDQAGTLPVGPEVNQGTLIDNDVDQSIVGHFEATIADGNAIGFSDTGFSGSGVTVQDVSTGEVLINQNYIFAYQTYVTTTGGIVSLESTTITQPATLIADDLVESRGTFAGPNGTVQWIATSTFVDGTARLDTRLELDGTDTALGDIQVVSYLDEDVEGISDDILVTSGTPGEADFRALTIDSNRRVGFAHGGTYIADGESLLNATYDGWSADIFNQLQTQIIDGSQTYSIDGDIDLTDLPQSLDPDFGFQYGEGDVTTAFAWTIDGDSTTATVSSFLELLATDPRGAVPPPTPGLWEGIVIREGADDRNVVAIAEDEPTRTSVVDANDFVGDGNPIPGQAQFLGELAPSEKAGDENRRLGFIVNGAITTADDLDVYSFIAESGTEVWFDIDLTGNQLDSVVELIDANGIVLAASNDSLLGETDSNALYSRAGAINPDAVQPLSVAADRLPSQLMTFSESIFAATGGTIALKISTSTNFVNVDVVDMQTTPALAVSTALRSTFPELGDFTVTRVESSSTSDLVLELEFDPDQFVGQNIPLVQVDTLGVVGATVTATVTEEFTKSQLQDIYTTNEKDAGMRILLPGENGTRNLYHVRVRSSNTLDPTNFAAAGVRDGLSKGAYQLQIRLSETDEFAGTQIRHADVRYAVDGLQIIGQPLHSPLLGEEYEVADDNDLRDSAQVLGYLSASNDQLLVEAGPLQSDRLAKSFAGELSSATDVDWYQFEIQYNDLVTDSSPIHLSSVIDLDYASGFARADMAFYVFNANGELIYVAGNSNISDDLPTTAQSNSTTDLSRGSAGTNDPYLGAAELVEGTYFIAVSNQQQVPLPIDQFFNTDSANPLLRLEPVDSVVRIAEDRIGSFGGGTAEAPVVPLLFDQDSIIPYSLDDVLLYVNTGSTLHLVNPFTGDRYVEALGGFGVAQGINEIAFQANGELFAYTNNGPIASDAATQYVRIDSSDATVTNIGGLGITTFHQNPIDPPDDGSLDVNSDTGLQVNGITIAAFQGSETGFFVADRVGPISGLQYSQDVLYAFDEVTGLVQGPIYADPNQFDAGAGTSPRELGRIDVDEVGSLARLGISAASVRNSDGVIVPGLADGDTFTITAIGGGEQTFELDQGFTIVADNNPVRDGDRLEIDGTAFEFNTGTRLQLSDPVPSGSLAVGTTIEIGFAGITRTFEFVTTNAPAPGNARISLLTTTGAARTAAAIGVDLANEINLRFPGIDAESFSNEVFFAGEPTSIAINGTGVATVGDDVVADPAAIEVLVNETVAPDELMGILEVLFSSEGIDTDRVGTQMALPTAAAVTVEPVNDTLATGLFRDGVPGVLTGNVLIPIAPGDSVEVIRQKFTDAIDAATAAGALTGVSVDEAGSTENSILIDGGTVTATGNLTGGAQAAGGSVVGIEVVGNTLYALTDVGGLFTVPASRLTVPGANGNNPSIADPVSTATELAGLNVTFTALRSGPDSVNDGELQQMLFGMTNTGDIYAFNLAGELQPIFAGGRTSISTGIGGALGLDFSTLDYNLFHVTAQRGTDDGHGINALDNGTRDRSLGGNSLAFTYETSAFASNYANGELPVRRNTSGEILNPRQDGQLIEDTYNFPGGAHGAVESNPFSLAGYSAADQPVLYFNYFMETQGANGADTLRVYVITPDGVEHLVATNNLLIREGTPDDEFDDPDLDDNVDAQVQQLYDTTLSQNDTWRQARVQLNDFAEMSGLRLRVEFATAGSTQTTSDGLRVVSGAALAASVDRQFVLQSNSSGGGNQRFELEFVPSVAFPSGPQLADLYQDPAALAVIEIEGQDYILDDGTRTPGLGQVTIDLLATQPVGTTLADLSGADVAAAVARQVLPLGGAVPTISGINFSDPEDVPGESGRNDTLATATPLPYTGGNLQVFGDGRLGTIDATSGIATNLDDVDLVQLTVAKDTVIEIDVQILSAAVADPAIRFFDANGSELPVVVNSLTGLVTHTAAEAGTIFIGISGAGNDLYDPNDISTVVPGDVDEESSYTVTLSVTPLGAIGNTVEFDGATLPIVAAPTSLFQVDQPSGTPGVIGIPVSKLMSAREVAAAVQQAIADRFAGGDPDLVPQTGTSLRLGGLSIQDSGPFTDESDRYEFASGASAGTEQNEFEGIYLDDFIIGFAERGEIATDSNVVDGAFIADARPSIPVPNDPTSGLDVGTYQVEIRDASEYVATADATQFRAFDTNQRLAGAGSITARSASEIRDGATFSIDDGRKTILFEFDLEESGTPVESGRVPVPFTLMLEDPETGLVRAQTAAEVAMRIVEAIQSPDVQNLINVSAVVANGVDGQSNPNINLSEGVLVKDLGGALAAVGTGQLRGDQNRARDAQGVIVVENSRFLYNSEHGIVISHGLTAEVAGQTTQSVVRYQRNLVELNTEQIKPGVVIQSNVLAFNEFGGLQVNGIETGANDTAADPVPFDRIVNNSIIGGDITAGIEAPPEEFFGVLFPQGAISFADAVVEFDPNAGGTPPDAIHLNADAALGSPDCNGFGPEPVDSELAVSLGAGGTITLQFTNNLLTGNGDASADLVVFETGEVESVRVEISRDGVNFFDVGVVGGLANTVDLDAFGFGLQDQFAFVRLTDLRQGSSTSGPIGADIDAVGAISTVPVELFFAAGLGIELNGNASPALLNNVVANSEVGLQIENAATLPILGGNSFYRNSTNVSAGTDLGQFPQEVSDSEVLFFGAGDLVFVPAAGSSIIDSAIDSLEDRASLTTVKNPLGLLPSPIIAPRLDVNGQLRTDDPNVEPPSGLGERVFKDRGASDRGDLVGPRVVLLSPPAENLGLTAGVATVDSEAPQFFEIQLLDGLAPADVVPGTGVDDRTVTSNSVLLLKDGVLQVEGVDYRFGYNPSTNVMRLTPIAGVWQQESTYVIRMVDSQDAIIQALDGDNYADGDLLRVVDQVGATNRFEFETGIVLSATSPTIDPTEADGLLVEVFDGTTTRTFELDNDLLSSPGNVRVPILETDSIAEIATALADAINASGLNITALATETGIQFLGTNPLSSVSTEATELRVSGAIGTSIGFGIQVPNDGTAVADTVTEGQFFTIRRGAANPVTFEFDTDGQLEDIDNVRVVPTDITDLDSVANAIFRAVAGAGLGLSPFNAGSGRVFLGGDATYAVDPLESTLEVIGTPGQGPTIPIVIGVDQTSEETVQTIANAITGQNLPGLTATVFGSRIFLEGSQGISGVGASDTITISDLVGNQVQSNQADGRTELTIFVGGGFDYGDAPYASSTGDDAARHGVDTTFALAPLGSATTVSADSEAKLIDADDDNGVFVSTTLEPGFDSSVVINVTNSSGAAFQINAWFDWDASGSFDVDELITISSSQFGAAAEGQLTIPLSVPGDAAVGDTFARFRLFRPSENPTLGPDGDAASGEVEDYRIVIGNNPFQNPNPILDSNGDNVGRYDVNNSGFVSAIDALQIINAMRRNGGADIDLSSPPLPTDLPVYPDVNGDGKVSALDALQVINKLDDIIGDGEAMGGSVAVASSFVPVSNGVLASRATLIGDQWIADGQAEQNGYSEQNVTIDQPIEKIVTEQSSVFDQPAIVELESVVDSIAESTLESRITDKDNPVDRVFGSL